MSRRSRECARRELRGHLVEPNIDHLNAIARRPDASRAGFGLMLGEALRAILSGLSMVKDSAPLGKLFGGLLHPVRVACDARIETVETLLADAAEFAPAGDADEDELPVRALRKQRPAAVALTGITFCLLPARADHVLGDELADIALDEGADLLDDAVG
jgi:hypothetical protein